MNSKRPSVVKSTTRAASGGVIVVAALLMLMFLRGSGDGKNDASGPATDDSSNPALATTETPADQTPADVGNVANSESDNNLTDDEKQAVSGSTLGILIDDWDYLLEIPGESSSIYRPTTLDRLLQLTAQTEGDTNGIRIRILQRESARPKAEQALREGLGNIGITADAIYMPSEFIP